MAQEEELPTVSQEPAAQELPQPSPEPKLEAVPIAQEAKEPFPKIVVAALIFLLLAAAVFIAVSFLARPTEFIYPISDNPTGQTLGTAKSTRTIRTEKKVIGFLPFWNLAEEPNFRYQLLSHLAFFGLDIDRDGQVRKLQNDGTEEPGWTAYKSEVFGRASRKARDSGAKVLLVIRAMENETIESILASEINRARVIKQTLEIVELKNLDGVNIDFEYGGSPPRQTAENFTRFVAEMAEAGQVRGEPLEISVDVYAGAAKKIRLWQIEELAPLVDYFVIMAYDFHQARSATAGPVAPLGPSQKYDEDVVRSLADFSQIVPLEKLVLGVPYYGYEWATTSDQANAFTVGKGALATYRRVRRVLLEEDIPVAWDRDALSPWFAYKKDGAWSQIYFENSASLKEKYNLVHAAGLAGIAIWALGYDGPYPELWDLLTESFPSTPR